MTDKFYINCKESGQGILAMFDVGFDELIEALLDELDGIIKNGK